MAEHLRFEALAGQRVLVVGGSSGIGLAVAEGAAQHGASVTITGRDPAKAAAAAAALGRDAAAVTFEMTDEPAVAAFFAANSPFDHVVVTAAQLHGGRVRDLPMELARATFESKFWGPYLIARHARITERGSIVLTS
ncbi:MAG: SDR family NAD(P)-dependent oxidoreductase, partial [Sphingopyxis sp.]